MDFYSSFHPSLWGGRTVQTLRNPDLDSLNCGVTGFVSLTAESKTLRIPTLELRIHLRKKVCKLKMGIGVSRPLAQDKAVRAANRGRLLLS